MRGPAAPASPRPTHTPLWRKPSHAPLFSSPNTRARRRRRRLRLPTTVAATATCSTAAQFKGTVQPIARNAGALAYGSLADAKKAVPGGIVSDAGKPLYTSAFETLRKERANARLVGIREKKAKEAAAKDAAAAKKAGKAGDAADE